MATDMTLNKKAPPDLPNGEEQDTFQAKYSMFLPVGEVRRGFSLFIVSRFDIAIGRSLDVFVDCY